MVGKVIFLGHAFVVQHLKVYLRTRQFPDLVWLNNCATGPKLGWRRSGSGQREGRREGGIGWAGGHAGLRRDCGR